MLERVDPVIDFPEAADGDPAGDFESGTGSDTFSVRWVGAVLIDEEAADWTLHWTTNEGGRLFLDGEALVDDWMDREGDAALTRSTAPLRLRPGWHPITLEVYERTGDAAAILEWESLEAGVARAVVPTDHLGVAEAPEGALGDLGLVRVEALTPDAAVVVFDAEGAVTGSVEYGVDDTYGSESTGQTGNTVRLSGLTPGRLYHYRLTLSDTEGHEVRTEDLLFCTPAEDELDDGLVRPTTEARTWTSWGGAGSR